MRTLCAGLAHEGPESGQFWRSSSSSLIAARRLRKGTDELDPDRRARGACRPGDRPTHGSSRRIPRVRAAARARRASRKTSGQLAVTERDHPSRSRSQAAPPPLGALESRGMEGSATILVVDDNAENRARSHRRRSRRDEGYRRHRARVRRRGAGISRGVRRASTPTACCSMSACRASMVLPPARGCVRSPVATMSRSCS